MVLVFLLPLEGLFEMALVGTSRDIVRIGAWAVCGGPGGCGRWRSGAEGGGLRALGEECGGGWRE